MWYDFDAHPGDGGQIRPDLVTRWDGAEQAVPTYRADQLINW